LEINAIRKVCAYPLALKAKTFDPLFFSKSKIGNDDSLFFADVTVQRIEGPY
jgi:hypothetical protein